MTAQQENKAKKLISYKSMLLGVNGVGDDYTSEEVESWKDEEESKNRMQEEDID